MSSLVPRSAPVDIERGGASDLDEVMAVMDGAFDSCFGERWSRSQCAGILPLSGVELTIARSASGIAIGFALQRTVADESELLLIAVDRAAQRLGIGRQLIDRFIASSRATGAHRLHLEVRDGNPATEIYRRFGFRPEGRRRNYYRGTDGRLFDAVTMSLTID